MKFGPVTKPDKRSNIALKNFDNDVISSNWNEIVIFPIYGQFGQSGSWIPDV